MAEREDLVADLDPAAEDRRDDDLGQLVRGEDRGVARGFLLLDRGARLGAVREADSDRVGAVDDVR